MRFRGQRHGLVFRLLWSPHTAGNPSRRRPYQSYRLEIDDSPRVFKPLRAWHAFLRGGLQVAVHKGDMLSGEREPTFLLTNRQKPIIINSFHRAEGLESVVRFSFMRVNPLDTFWNQRR
jgi:hypothetical protein